jgi:hypothetical protein
LQTPVLALELNASSTCSGACSIQEQEMESRVHQSDVLMGVTTS